VSSEAEKVKAPGAEESCSEDKVISCAGAQFHADIPSVADCQSTCLADGMDYFVSWPDSKGCRCCPVATPQKSVTFNVVSGNVGCIQAHESELEVKHLARQYCAACRIINDPENYGEYHEGMDVVSDCWSTHVTSEEGERLVDIRDDDIQTLAPGGRRRDTCYHPTASTIPVPMSLKVYPYVKNGAHLSQEARHGILKNWTQTDDAQAICGCFNKWSTNCPEDERTQCVMEGICQCTACDSFKEQWGCRNGWYFPQPKTLLETMHKRSDSTHDAALLALEQQSVKKSMDTSLVGKCGG